MNTSRPNLTLHIGFLAAILTILVATGATARFANAPTLKDAYKHHFYVGVAINRTIATGEAGYGYRTLEQVNKDIALTKEQFNQISPENDLKWASIHPREGADGYDFGPADAYVDFGLKHQMYIVGHTLVWHGQTPNWVFAGKTPPAAAGKTNGPAPGAANTPPPPAGGTTTPAQPPTNG